MQLPFTQSLSQKETQEVASKCSPTLSLSINIAQVTIYLDKVANTLQQAGVLGTLVTERPWELRKLQPRTLTARMGEVPHISHYRAWIMGFVLTVRETEAHKGERAGQQGSVTQVHVSVAQALCSVLCSTENHRSLLAT